MHGEGKFGELNHRDIENKRGTVTTIGSAISLSFLPLWCVLLIEPPPEVQRLNDANDEAYQRAEHFYRTQMLLRN